MGAVFVLLQYIRFTAQICVDPFILSVAFLAGMFIKTHPVRLFFLLAFAMSYTIILWEATIHDGSVPMYVLMACRFFGSLAITYILYGIRMYLRKKSGSDAT
ncbi:hypothetical protein LJC23_03005 [Desulfovibrio sp. OttesenSCG-928-I05]|nr:hypothetical protein [Desulfovibrio sp. OttesenSCG-928-I05]